MYIHQLNDWPNFRWDMNVLAESLEVVQLKRGKLLGRMESLGFKLRQEADLGIRTKDVLKTSEIEGELLDPEQVRSSLARRLQMKIPGLRVSSPEVDGIVDMNLDSTKNYKEPLTAERLYSWHSSLFPDAITGLFSLSVGKWRDGKQDPMQVVSGPIGRQKVHFEAPAANLVRKEMREFIKWFEQTTDNKIIKSGIAHLWFVTVHPFEDGNGRIARAIADLLLARSDDTTERFYSMSSQICAERKTYYEILERTQKNSLNITKWLEWYLACLDRAIETAQTVQDSVINKAHFWDKVEKTPLNDRQRKVINKLLDGFEGNLNSSKWARIAKCSQDTAHRDILELISLSILQKDSGGGRSTTYSLKTF